MGKLFTPKVPKVKDPARMPDMMDPAVIEAQKARVAAAAARSRAGGSREGTILEGMLRPGVERLKERLG